MVENHVCAVGHSGAVLAVVAVLSHAHSEVSADDVVGTREAYAVAIDRDALSRCRLSGNVEVALEYHSALDIDDTAYVEHHDTVALRHCIAQ